MKKSEVNEIVSKRDRKYDQFIANLAILSLTLKRMTYSEYCDLLGLNPMLDYNQRSWETLNKMIEGYQGVNRDHMIRILEHFKNRGNQP